MSESGYPENWKFEDEGKAVLEGKLKSITAVQAADFTTGEPVQKFVANIETKDGTVWAVWLDSAVLNRAFRDEAKNRKAVGERFKDDERVAIEYLGKRKGSRFEYKDFRVQFEYAAPSVSGFDALAGAVDVPSNDHDTFLEEAATGEGMPNHANDDETAEDVKTTSQNDQDIPF